MKVELSALRYPMAHIRWRMHSGPDQWRSDGVVGAGLALPEEGAASGAPTSGTPPWGRFHMPGYVTALAQWTTKDGAQLAHDLEIEHRLSERPKGLQ